MKQLPLLFLAIAATFLLLGCGSNQELPKEESMADVLKDIDPNGTSKDGKAKKVDPKAPPSGGGDAAAPAGG